MLLTRPAMQSESCARHIEEVFPNEFNYIISPLLAIEPTGVLPDLASFQAILFTSANGVRQFIEKGGKTNAPCFCVGDRTTATARMYGLDGYSAKGSSVDLVRLVENTCNSTAGPLLYIRGEKASGDIAGHLRTRNFSIKELTLYRQIPCDLSMNADTALVAGDIDIAAFYSPMTAAIFAKKAAENTAWKAANLCIICISQNVKKQVEALNASSVSVAETPSQDAMIARMGEYLRGDLLPL